MNAVGIIAEYNPFHTGHLAQLRRIRESVPDAPVVVALSGDFVQRGEAATFSKFARAEAAVRCGASLVLELPLPWCLSSAEGFARGGVGLLRAAGEVDCLSSAARAGMGNAWPPAPRRWKRRLLRRRSTGRWNREDPLPPPGRARCAPRWETIWPRC